MKQMMRILIINDDSSLGSSLGNRLVQWNIPNYQKNIDSLEDLYNAMKIESWDIIISNHEFSAFTVLDVRNTVSKLLLDIPIIVISHNLQEESILELIKAGIYEYVDKSDLLPLKRIIYRILSRDDINKIKAFRSSSIPMLILDENLFVVKANDSFAHFVRKEPAKLESIKIGEAFGCGNKYHGQAECGHGKYCFQCKLVEALRKVNYTSKAIGKIKFQYNVSISNVLASLDLSISANPVVINAKKYIEVTLENMDDVKKNTSFIEESLELFHKTFNSSSYFLWGSSIDGKCAFINSSWLKFTGRTVEEELGNGWMDRLHPDDRISFQKSGQEIEHNEEFMIEFRVLRFDGVYRWISVIGRPIYKQDGELTGYVGISFDITDKKLELDALSKYKLLAESVDDIILFLDKHGNILEGNNSAVRSYGYTHEELLSLNISDLREQVAYMHGQPHRTKQERFSYDIYHKRNDGSRFPVEIRVNSAMMDEEELYISVIRDMTEHKKAEQEIQASEQRYYSLFTNMSEAFLYGKVICDDQGTPIDYLILEVNSAFEEMTGLRREDILNRTAGEVNPAIRNSEPNLIRNCGQVALTGESIKFELKMKPSEKVYIVSTYSPQPECFVNVFADITEQKRAEFEIRKLSSALEQSSAMAVITDTAGNVEYVNSKFELITGYSYEEIRGKHIDIVSSGKMSEKLMTNMWKVINKGQEWSGEFLNKRKNGEYYWVSASISPVRDQDGRITNFTAIQEDITAKKELERELKLNNKKLKKAVKELKSMQALLIQQEKLAGIGQLAAGVAHEINNPLGFVISNFDILRKYNERLDLLIAAFRILNRSLKNEDYQMVVKQLQQIDEMEEKINLDYILQDTEDIFDDCNDGLMRIKNIVKGLSIFVRSENNQVFSDYDINAGIEYALIVAHNEIKHHAEVIKELENVPGIQASGDRINQVLLNIIVNAAHAIAANNQKLKGLITIKTYYDVKNIYCEIIDNGIGISKENINKIFNPFFTTKAIGQGTGLGLSISYDIITNVHNGQLIVHSKEGEGTRFMIKLPISI
ncbi:MAG TPA: PAS domain S-box protein [Patescibacteria group bacterium]|nr:PAS domain S-box protein [Patescibacteria group bacterium]